MRRTIPGLVLALLALAVSASAFEAGVKGAYWIADFSGKVRIDDGGKRGTELGFSDDLGIDDENFFFGEAWLWVGRHHLTFSGMRVDYSGHEKISEEIRFGGTRFAANATVDSSLEYTMLDLAYQYDVLDLENVLAGFSLGPIVQVKYLDGEVKMDGLAEAGLLPSVRQKVNPSESRSLWWGWDFTWGFSRTTSRFVRGVWAWHFRATPSTSSRERSASAPSLSSRS